MNAATSRSASLVTRGGFVALLAALALLLVMPAAASAQGTITVSNLQCYTSGPLGYSFTVSGSGFAPSASMLVFLFDNLNPGPAPAGQFEPVTTDANGVFSFDFAGGSAQTLPVSIEATDMAFNVLSGPISTGTVSCTQPPPPPPVVPTTTDQCKNGGWQAFLFTNQGDCVSFVVNHQPLT